MSINAVRTIARREVTDTLSDWRILAPMFILSFILPQLLIAGAGFAIDFVGDPNTIVNEVLSFEPERMLSIRVQQAPANFPLPQAVRRMWTVIYFQRLEPGMTNVRVVGLGFGEDADSHKLREYFRKGNAETLEQLQKRYWPSCALCEKDPSLTAPASTRK